MPLSEEQIAKSRRLLENPYAYLNGDGGYSAIGHQAFGLNLDEIRSPEIVGTRFSSKKIEEIARSVQNALYVNRQKLWKDEASDDLVAVLNPAVAFEALGYKFEVSDSLGQFSTSQGMVDIAGFIDRSKMHAGVSDQFPSPTQNFTAAHELGHAILHDAVGMYRDRALHGGGVLGPRDREEIEADKFASYFLMPENVMRIEFQKRFSSEQFVISDDTAFALISASQDVLRSEYTNLRRLARKLADADFYAGRFFESLSKRFNVSTESMAIRLEELQLLQL